MLIIEVFADDQSLLCLLGAADKVIENNVENILRLQISMEKRVEKILASVRDQTSAEA